MLLLVLLLPVLLFYCALQQADDVMGCRRLDQVLKRYRRGEIKAVDWLDALALQKIEHLRHEVRDPRLALSHWQSIHP